MIELLLVLVIVGVCLYLIETYVPLAPPIKVVIRVVVILVLALWLLRVFGVGICRRCDCASYGSYRRSSFHVSSVPLRPSPVT